VPVASIGLFRARDTCSLSISVISSSGLSRLFGLFRLFGSLIIPLINPRCLLPTAYYIFSASTLTLACRLSPFRPEQHGAEPLSAPISPGDDEHNKDTIPFPGDKNMGDVREHRCPFTSVLPK
jgi:hypothetical protein